MGDLWGLTGGRMTALAAELNRFMALSSGARAQYAAVYGTAWVPLTNADGTIDTGMSHNVVTPSALARTVTL